MKQRLIYADVLRIFATLAVIVLHVSASNWANVAINTTQWQVFNYFDSAVRWCVPIFVMLSGMFFLDPKKIITTKSLFTKYIFRIVTAYIFWSASYSIYVYLDIYRTINSGVIQNMILHFIVGHYHLWFLFMIVALYLITPFLRMITAQASQNMLTYFLMLFFIFGSIFPLLPHIPGLGNTFNTIIFNTGMHFVTWYVGFYVMGYYLKTYDFSPKVRWLIYGLGIVGLISTAWLTSTISLALNAPSTIFYSYLAPNVVLTSAALFLFFKNVIGAINWSGKSLEVIQMLSASSFGIYLVHDFFIILAAKLGLTTLAFNPLLAIPLISCFVFTGSFIVVFLTTKLPLIKKLKKYIM